MDSLSNVFARNCSIRRIDKSEAACFLNACHRFGYSSCRYRYGLFIERSTSSHEIRIEKGTLAAVATFSSGRKWEKEGKIIKSYEWIRYASLPGIRVVGGMGKILRYFEEEVHPDDIMSYVEIGTCDEGETYSSLGFEMEGIIEKPGFRNYKFRKKNY